MASECPELGWREIQFGTKRSFNAEEIGHNNVADIRQSVLMEVPRRIFLIGTKTTLSLFSHLFCIHSLRLSPCWNIAALLVQGGQMLSKTRHKLDGVMIFIGLMMMMLKKGLVAMQKYILCERRTAGA